MPQRVPATDQEAVQQPQLDEYVTPRRTTRAISLTRTKPTTALNTFQILIENEIREMATHEIRVRTPLMDSILSWKIRGLNGPNKQEDVKIFLQKNFIGLVGLLEMKVKGKNVSNVAGNLCPGWHWHSNIQSNEKGRTLIMWRPNYYAVTKGVNTNQMVHCEVVQLSTQRKFYLTIVYGFNKVDQRRPLWHDLKLVS